MFIIFQLNLLSLFSGVETRGAFLGDVTSVQTDNHESPTTTKPSCLLAYCVCVCVFAVVFVFMFVFVFVPGQDHAIRLIGLVTMMMIDII